MGARVDATGHGTLKGKTAYFWCNRWPGKELAIGGLQTQAAQGLVSWWAGSAIAFEQTDNRLVLKGLPAQSPDAIAGVTVIKLECDAQPIRS